MGSLLAAWLAGWLAGGMAGWWAGELVGWLAGGLTGFTVKWPLGPHGVQPRRPGSQGVTRGEGRGGRGVQFLN